MLLIMMALQKYLGFVLLRGPPCYCRGRDSRALEATAVPGELLGSCVIEEINGDG